LGGGMVAGGLCGMGAAGVFGAEGGDFGSGHGVR
jgi:hypothetical protein